MAYEITDTSGGTTEFTIKSSENKFRVIYYKDVLVIEMLDEKPGDYYRGLVTLPIDSVEAIYEALHKLMSKVKKPHYLMSFKDDLDIALNDFGVKIVESVGLTSDILDKFQTVQNLIKEIREELK